MSGEFRGVQAYVQEKVPSAVYTHCASHSLNLCLSDASKVSFVRNCMGVIKEVNAFFHMSAKRTEILKCKIAACCQSDYKKRKLISLCETRWVKRHDSVLMFKEILEPIILALLDIENESFSREAAAKAHGLSNSICQFQFIVSLFVLSDMLSITLNLSETLQKKEIDLSKAVKKISAILENVSLKRSSANEHFAEIYKEAKIFSDKIKVPEDVPRTCKLQVGRSNITYSSAEEYYRRSIYVPYLDDFSSSLKERFESHQETVASLQCVLPEFCVLNDFESLEPAFHFYEADLSYKEVVKSEYALWKNKWSQESEDLPKTAVCALVKCDKDFFPNLYILLKILAVLPVSVATAERSFSSLRRLKTYLRNTTSENRLNGLALLSIHRDIYISDEKVIDKFASLPRKLDFVL